MAIIGYWRFNGNTNDASGNSNNGSNTNVSYVNGLALYNGSAATSIGSIATMNERGTHTINCLVYIPYQANRASSSIFLKSSDKSYVNWVTDGWGIQLMYVTNASGYVKVNVGIVVTNGTGVTNYDAADPFYSIPPDTWFMATAIYNYENATLRLYINSKFIKETLIINSTRYLRTSNPAGWGGTIAASNWGPWGYYGYFRIDNLFLVKGDMKDSQIKNEYSRIKGFF